MVNFKTITCEICGQFAQVPKRRRLNYCDNPDCVKAMERKKWCEYTNRYMRKKKEEKETTQNKIVVRKETNDLESNFPVTTKTYFDEVKSILTKQKVNTEALDNIEIYDIREIARQLGTIRFKLIEMYQKENGQVKELDKEDITMLHTFEFQDLTKDEVWEIYKETKSRRTSRRGDKNRRILIGALLSSIQIKNPDKFIVKAINDGRKNKDFPEVVEELKKDETLFVQPKEKEDA